MPNLQGASPVGRGEGGRSYVARMVSEVSSRGETGALRSTARERIGVVHGGQTTQARSRRMLRGKEDHDSARSSVGSRLSYRRLSD